MGAVRLLSQHNFDALQYTNEVNNLSFDVSTDLSSSLCKLMF
jgi:hypothetical protein